MRETLWRAMDTAVAEGALRPLDRAFARFVVEIDPGCDDAVVAAAALCSQRLGEGHTCLFLPALEAPATPDDALAYVLPALPAGMTTRHWQERLLASPAVASAQADGRALLVLDGERLYLKRYWDHECQVAAAIGVRTGRWLPMPQTAQDELQRLYPAAAIATVNWQKVACAIAAQSAFCVITGGPGTGKTTTVVRLIALLQTAALAGAGQRLRIRLAAPTGKAAARLKESIAAQVEVLPISPEVRQAIPADVSTVHRLLGSRPDQRRPRHHRGNPLHVDVLIVDEASMVDLETMAALLDALPPDARLILLGDKDQLASVEAGAVLGDLCRNAAAGRYWPDTIAAVERVAGEPIDAFAGAGTALDQHVVMLRESHRFGEHSEIGRLAAAVNRGDAAAATEVLRAPAAAAAVRWLAGRGDADAAIIRYAVDGGAGDDGFGHYLRVLQERRPGADAATAAYAQWAEEVLAARSAFQIVCAVRHGEAGVAGLNARIAAALQAAGHIPVDRGWYEGRPVMLTRNDYALGLMNGDLGVTLRVTDPAGRAALRVAFATTSAEGERRIRFVPPSRLEAVETVYAMTVHKSQGSEFHHVALVLPGQHSPVVTRELVYTAVTRARRRFSLIAGEDALVQAIGRQVERTSGLAGRFGA
ncbi:exodeoxyribonuclease V subunit alpha [Tahibacter amnicola]|uniref:RecBCD enzyme subunit RecD n=1 Tax=Tahibacter amnicola TaxID=2976241 RepID=A0ABY6BH64_9GAMM|nr:exodeoxyribonuclease V subunit alpha [Tahibacter amnicola]UXI68668.1 exodeoxyribonuclease V subunit alpha [Tahibacter amnicola]